MSDISVINTAIQFIEVHLREEITVADMAASVSFSLFHFSRTFSRITRHTPYDYLMRRRLCEAARCLLESDQKIIDVAYAYQFKAPETFSRAFKRLFHIQPRQLKMGRGMDQRRLMGVPTPEYLAFINGEPPIKPQAQELPALRIAGLAAQLDSDHAPQALEDLWALLRKELAAEEYDAHKRTPYGLRVDYPSFSPGKIMYLAGISLGVDEDGPSFLVQKNMPAQKYVTFSCPQSAAAAPFIRDFLYQTWWPKATEAPLPRIELDFYSQLESTANGPATIGFPLG